MNDDNIPDEIDVSGMVDTTNPGIEFIGKARRDKDGKWRCFANVTGSLCIVEVRVVVAESKPSATP